MGTLFCACFNARGRILGFLTPLASVSAQQGGGCHGHRTQVAVGTVTIPQITEGSSLFSFTFTTDIFSRSLQKQVMMTSN